MELPTVEDNKFKNSNGLYLLRALFFEEAQDKQHVLYSLKEYDHPDGYPSLYKLYMLMEDPTEYRFAKTYLDGWTHWTQLCEAPWFKPIVEGWRKELSVKLSSDALLNMLDIAGGGGRDAYGANKYLLDNGWFKKEANRVGRPTKEEVKSHLKEEADKHFEIQEDMKRLNLTIQ